MEKFTAEDEKLFDDYPDLVYPFEIYQEFMRAEIEYFKGNHKTSLHRLAEVLKIV
jgi:hypothetical protein